MHHGAVKWDCRKTPPVRRTERSTSERGSIAVPNGDERSTIRRSIAYAISSDG
jgi:hypothetical protein